MTPSATGDFSVTGRYGVYWICESDLARLPRTGFFCDRGELKTDFWARYEVEKTFDLGLFPDGLDPFVEDCAREMTRGEFADTLLKLYQRLGGSVANLSRNTPFTDLPNGNQRRSIALAYNLGLVEGISETSFSPDDPFTREQAAVMLTRIYEKMAAPLYEDFSQAYSPDVSFEYSNYKDKAQISPWARFSVFYLSDERHIIEGAGDFWTFAPQKPLTLQEGMALIQRVLDDFAFERYWGDLGE